MCLMSGQLEASTVEALSHGGHEFSEKKRSGLSTINELACSDTVLTLASRVAEFGAGKRSLGYISVRFRESIIQPSDLRCQREL